MYNIKSWCSCRYYMTYIYLDLFFYLKKYFFKLKQESAYCVFDFKVFFNVGKYDLKEFTNQFSWFCYDSYILSSDPTKVNV